MIVKLSQNCQNQFLKSAIFCCRREYYSGLNKSGGFLNLEPGSQILAESLQNFINFHRVTLHGDKKHGNKKCSISIAGERQILKIRNRDTEEHLGQFPHMLDHLGSRNAQKSQGMPRGLMLFGARTGRSVWPGRPCRGACLFQKIF